MKKLGGILLRVVGVALVAFILWRIQYRDVLEVGEGEEDYPRGTVVVDGDSARLEVHGRDEVVDLGPDWRENASLTLGLFTIVRLSNKGLLLLCLLVYGPISLLSITRWWYLLRRVGIPTPYGETFRLTYIGFFFNNAVPGLTGGDLVKAFYISRQAEGARVRAFMSVLVDRVLGLFALGLLAGAVVIPSLGDPSLRLAGMIVYACLAVGVVGGVVFLSGTLRRLFRVETLVAKLPFAHQIKEIGRAVLIYREVPGAVVAALAVSVLNHVSLVLVAIGVGSALGIDLPVSRYFVLFPVCMMLASIPALPGGWGVREGAFAFFFGAVGVPPTMAVTLSIIIGLIQLAWSLLGGLIFLARPDRVTREDLMTFSDEVEADVDEEPAAGT